MASAIEDVKRLPGESLADHEGLKIGEIKRLYAGGGGEEVMWVTVETKLGVGHKREAFVPLARLKHEHDQLRVPYSAQHIQSSPEIEPTEQLSEGDEQALRAYYTIGFADQELRTDNDSYAGQVPDDDGPARQIDAEQAREPERDTGEAAERIRNEDSPEGKDKPRKATADDVVGAS